MADRRARSGLTLVELLVAMVIATLVVAVVYSTYRTVQAVAAGQRERDETRRGPVEAVEALQDDLQRLFDAGRPETQLVLTQRLDQAAVIFALLEPAPGEPDLRWSRAARVEWQVVETAGGRRALERAVRPLAGAGSRGPAVTNRLLDDVGRFVVSFHDGTNWTVRWPPGPSNAVPRLARVQLSARAAPTNEECSLEVWLPAGHTFTSRLQRLAAPGAVSQPGVAPSPP